MSDWCPEGFELENRGKHYHYVCKTCGDSFCSEDVMWSYHEHEETETKSIEGTIIDNAPYGYYIRPSSGYGKQSFEEFANEFVGKNVEVTIKRIKESEKR